MAAGQLLQSLNNELAGAFAKTRQSVVQIANGRRSGGAGVIWRSDGLVITNAHVIQSHRPEVILNEGQRRAASVIAMDKKVDLAALQIDSDGLVPIQQGDARSLQPGDWVMAVGHPWGVKFGTTAGAVIAVGSATENRYSGDLVQVGLHMRPGHSGGPLVNNQGHLVGINCMIAGPNVGLAIPNDVVKNFLEKHNLTHTQFI